jgi:diaminohydroxyphosphoribosylaminopyrimidine deaminase/5-amino-6-(5-phosphoribosylamino)uracil reductase
VEGGARLLQTFIDAGLWDEARVFTGKTWFQKGVRAPQLQVFPTQQQDFGNSTLYYFQNI